MHAKLGTLEAVVFINEAVGWRVRSDGAYEPDEFAALTDRIRPDAVCLDIGANIGLYSIQLAKLVPQGKVIAFEPEALNLAMLRLNIELNSLNNIQVLPVALSDVVGKLSFSVSIDGAFSSLSDTGRKPLAKTVTVESMTIDTLVDSGVVARADICKIDVEGAELLVLRGARKFLSDPALRPAALLVECNVANQAVYGYGPEDVLKLMESFNYDANSVTERGIVRGWPVTGASEYVLFTRRGDPDKLGEAGRSNRNITESS